MRLAGLAISMATAMLVACSEAPRQEPPLSDPGDRAAAATREGRSLSDVTGDGKIALSWTPRDAAAGADDAGQTPGESRFGQPMDERTAQQNLPQSPDRQWATLADTVIGEDLERGLFTARHPPRVRALNGKTMTISGYVMPLETTPTVRHFLLTRYTPVCSFCPPGAPNEVIEVMAGETIAPTQALVRVTGAFSLADNGEQGLFFRIDATSVEIAP